MSDRKKRPTALSRVLTRMRGHDTDDLIPPLPRGEMAREQVENGILNDMEAQKWPSGMDADILGALFGDEYD